MRVWWKFQPPAPVAELLDVRFHRADCALAQGCEICTCGAVMAAARAAGLQCDETAEAAAGLGAEEAR